MLVRHPSHLSQHPHLRVQPGAFDSLHMCSRVRIHKVIVWWLDSIVFITKRSQAPIRGPFIGMDYGLRSAFTLNNLYQSATVSSLGPEILVISTLFQTKPMVHLVSHHGSADFSPYLMNRHKSGMKLQATSYLTNFLSLIFLFENPGGPRTLQK